MLELQARFVPCEEAYQAFNDQQQLLTSDPTLMFDDGWKVTMGFRLGILDTTATNLENIPGVTPEYAYLDQLMDIVAVRGWISSTRAASREDRVCSNHEARLDG